MTQNIDNTVDNDIAYFQVQVSNRSDYDPALSTYYKQDRFVAGEHKTFKIKKPSGTYYARVRSVDASGNKSAWVSATGSVGAPPTPGSGPPLTFDRGGKKGIRATATCAYSGVWNDDDISKVQLQWQAEDINPVDGDKKHIALRHLDTKNTFPVDIVFHKLKAGEKVRARFRVVDTKDNWSDWSPWTSPIATASVGRKPGAVANLDKDVDEDGKFKTIQWRWDPPTTWDNGDPNGFTEDEVAGYDVTPRLSGSDQANKKATMHKSTRYQIRVAANSGPWTLKVEPRGWDGSISTSAISPTGVTAQPIGAADISTVGGSQVKDGIAPNTPSAPTLTASYKSFLATWPAVTNTADVVVYEVHVSTSSGFTPSGTTKVGEVTATGMMVNKTGAGALFDQNTTYYVKLIAKDNDGSSSPSAQSSVQPTGVAPPDIVAGTVASDLTITGLMSAPSTSGWRVEIGNSTYPLRYWNGSTTIFSVDNGGNAVFSGALSGASGSFAGDLTGGSVSATGVLYVGGPANANRIEIDGAAAGGRQIRFYFSGSGHIGRLAAGSGYLYLTGPAASEELVVADGQVISRNELLTQGGFRVDNGSVSTGNKMRLRSTGSSPAAPPTGYCEIFYDGLAGTNGKLKARNPTSVQDLATF